MHKCMVEKAPLLSHLWGTHCRYGGGVTEGDKTSAVDPEHGPKDKLGMRHLRRHGSQPIPPVFLAWPL